MGSFQQQNTKSIEAIRTDLSIKYALAKSFNHGEAKSNFQSHSNYSTVKSNRQNPIIENENAAIRNSNVLQTDIASNQQVNFTNYDS